MERSEAVFPGSFRRVKADRIGKGSSKGSSEKCRELVKVLITLGFWIIIVILHGDSKVYYVVHVTAKTTQNKLK